MRLNSHLAFDGRCEAAFKFYERILNARIVMIMRYGDSPMAPRDAVRVEEQGDPRNSGGRRKRF